MYKIILFSLLCLVQTTTFSSTPISAKQMIIRNATHPIHWKHTPKPNYTNDDLQDKNRKITVQLDSNVNGKITNVSILKSSGLTSLDEKVVKAVYQAQLQPYIENGITYPIRATQSFTLMQIK
jgi:TonB family protein